LDEGVERSAYMIPGLPMEPPPGTPGGIGYIPPGMPGSPEYIPPPGMPGSLVYHSSQTISDGNPVPVRSGKGSRWALLLVLAFGILFVGVAVWMVVALLSVIGAH
jgi:hypothetical protein